MSVDIIPINGAAMNITNVAWRFALEFGHLCGWKPSGTLKPEWYAPTDQWDGAYDPAMGQFVSNEDAVSLSDALMNGLRNPSIDELLSQVTANLTTHAARLGYRDGPAAKVSDKSVDMLGRLAELTRVSGGFRIT